jgi:phosphoglycerate dehydrogenase-like enzyme
MPKLCIVSRDAEAYRTLIEQANLPHLEIVNEPAECDIVLGEPRQIANLLPLLSRLKWVQSIYAGVEFLVQPGQRRDYILTNARGVFGGLMSEFVFGYLLAFERKIFEYYRSQQARLWDRTEAGSLRGKRLGLLGVGSIGSHLAGMAKHFGMTVWGFTRSSETCHEVARYFHPPDILQFASGLDYLVCVLPRTEGTNQIVNASLLEALPPRAILINVGRGNAVDNAALIEALQRGKLAAAVLDVTDPEPLPQDHPFWTTPNLYLTFHSSAKSYPADILNVFVENYHLYLAGQPLKYQVDFERGY